MARQWHPVGRCGGPDDDRKGTAAMTEELHGVTKATLVTFPGTTGAPFGSKAIYTQ
jgi:hypothetical protein